MYSKIHDRIWKDEKFKTWPEDEKILFLYLVTCHHKNIVGLFYLPPTYIQADINWSLQRVGKSFQCLEKEMVVSREGDYILIFNYLKHNPIANPNMAKGAIFAIKEIPKIHLLTSLLECLKGHDIGHSGIAIKFLTGILDNGKDFAKPKADLKPDLPSDSKKFLPSIDIEKEIEKIFEEFGQMRKTVELFVDLFRRENKTETISKTRVLNILREIKELNLTGEELRMGCSAAIGAGAANIKYLEKAGRSKSRQATDQNKLPEAGGYNDLVEK